MKTYTNKKKRVNINQEILKFLSPFEQYFNVSWSSLFDWGLEAFTKAGFSSLRGIGTK